jgi:3-oxoacyl-(acyl-carrier-protein) synthase
LIASEEAINQAGWQPQNEMQSERTATIIASGIGGFPAKQTLFARSKKRVQIGYPHLPFLHF